MNAKFWFLSTIFILFLPACAPSVSAVQTAFPTVEAFQTESARETETVIGTFTPEPTFTPQPSATAHLTSTPFTTTFTVTYKTGVVETWIWTSPNTFLSNGSTIVEMLPVVDLMMNDGCDKIDSVRGWAAFYEQGAVKLQFRYKSDLLQMDISGAGSCRSVGGDYELNKGGNFFFT